MELIHNILKQTAKDTGQEVIGASVQVSDLFVNTLDRKGRKSKGGFYEYPEGEKKYLWPDLKKHFPLKGEQPSVELVKERLLMAQAVEAQKAFGEGVLTDTSEGDVGSILGWGFPAFTGGIFSYIKSQGKGFETRCKELAATYGSNFSLN